MKNKLKAALAWILFGMMTISAVVQVPYFLNINSGQAGAFALMSTAIASALIPITFGLVGALISSRQPGNVIGLLLMLPGISLAIPTDLYLNQFSTAPADPNLPLIWFANWSWLLLFLPVLFILVLFPNGRPLTPRWRLPIYLGLVVAVLGIVGTTFDEELGALDGSWAVPNPIGFLRAGSWDEYLNALFLILLLLCTITSAAALFIRFRRSQGVEREQIKWLFYASALFALIYAVGIITLSWEGYSLWNALMGLSLALVPLAIGAAVLRFRLYDIDVVIRKTLVYTVLTGLLALLYLGTVLLLQSVFESVSGEQSPIAIVISTLFIAALFGTLRRRVQAFIDRRFYRRKYDAQKVLSHFAQTTWDEVSLELLTAELARAVQETMQPQKLSIWQAAESPAAPESAAPQHRLSE